MNYGSISWTYDSVVAGSSSCFKSRFTDLIEHYVGQPPLGSDVAPKLLQNTHHSFRVSDVRSQTDKSTLK